MPVNILRLNSSGPDVKRWEMFLAGQEHLRGAIDDNFGADTDSATRAFQRAHKLSADGIVGPKTLGAALSDGFDIGFVDRERGDAEAIVPDASSLRPLTSMAQRQAMFGPLEFEAAPVPSNPEAIRITSHWEGDNIVTVMVPQLVGKLVFGTTRSKGRIQFHRRAVPQLLALWAAWEGAGVLSRVLTYDGAYNPRFIRGSTTELSNHAFGTAFDINQKWLRARARRNRERARLLLGRQFPEPAGRHALRSGAHHEILIARHA
jgi:hypothetical protein